MSYSYYNDSGKLVSGAAANSHKIYTVYAGPTQFWLNAAVYAITGLMLAGMMRKGIRNIGNELVRKEKEPL